MRNHRFQDVDTMIAGRYWPDDLALAAAELHRDGDLTEPDVRIVDAFLRHLHKRRTPPSQVASEDMRTFGSVSRITRLANVLAHLDPALSRPARPVLRERRADLWAKRRPPAKRPDERPGARRVSLAKTEWPDQWREAVARLQRRSETANTDIVPVEDGAVHSPSVVRNLSETVAQLAKVHQDSGLASAVSIESVDLLLDAMARRGLRDITKAVRLKEMLIFACELGAKDDVGGYIRRLMNAFNRQAGRVRSRKEETYLGLDFTLGDVFQKARELHAASRDMGAHLDAALHARMDAALLGLSVNAPLRCGDLHRLRVGHELVRNAEGWRLAVTQAKTATAYRVDRLWDEVGGFLDALVLDGRAAYDLWARLEELDGKWLFSWNGGEDPVDDHWPTKVWQRHFGVGQHIVRTMWCSYYAEADPDNAWMASALLGHRGERSRRAYEVDVQRRRAVTQTQALIEGLLPDPPRFR